MVFFGKYYCEYLHNTWAESKICHRIMFSSYPENDHPSQR